jgi:hypothetical protein
MRTKLLFILIFFFGLNSFAQKMTGFGGELSVLSIKPNLRIWVSKTTGFEVFGGLASELGFKFLKCIMYNRTDRTYFGLVGKWKWVNVYGSPEKTNLPIPGLLIGKEWYSKRIHLKAFAVELGYQYGVNEYNIKNYQLSVKEKFEEFPLILNLRYSFYTKR